MNEADLEKLLQTGAHRLRLERALRLGLAALGGGILLTALAIFLLRLFPLTGAMTGLQTTLIQLALALPLLLAISVSLAVYQLTTPELATVALLLDRRANSKEHLVTWFEFRRSNAVIEPGFRAAQLAATLQRAASFNPRKLLPLRLPEWTRALWLALLLLCSALLMPPRADAARGSSTVREARGPGARLSAAPADSPAAETRQTPKVQPLSPTELLTKQLQVSNPDLSVAAKEKLFKELLQKIGNVPESELAPEISELLNMLRTESGAKKTEDGLKQDEKNGAQQTASSGTKTDVNPVNEVGRQANFQTFTERAFTQIGQSFPDVKEQLESYYKSAIEKK